MPATSPPKPPTNNPIRVCPECSGPIARASGCVSCIQCGWAKCN